MWDRHFLRSCPSAFVSLRILKALFTVFQLPVVSEKLFIGSIYHLLSKSYLLVYYFYQKLAIFQKFETILAPNFVYANYFFFFLLLETCSLFCFFPCVLKFHIDILGFGYFYLFLWALSGPFYLKTGGQWTWKILNWCQKVFSFWNSCYSDVGTTELVL